ncbi:hypothetical protein GW590_08390 [Rahnella sp. SAP-1]|uniref:DnaT DNA-binding domain-containing protein n=1 Tax=Rouxiella aceris TaxID=2703884 RepID=A0A848MIC0_9GAMM|nr:DnaT-like ssDNA-binding domain-containing protein [Rouxiella aceris]NMP26881.1 hypothetical protein [Rouxiella aceris]
MASSWIKIEVITPDKPEIFQLAEILNIDPDAVLGKMIRVWAWADQQTIDGNAKCNAAGVTKSVLDRVTCASGFANALIQVGWLAEEDGRLYFPNHQRHNGETSKKRALTNSRVTKMRESKRNGNAESNAGSVTGAYQKPLPEEELEEEVKDKPSLSGEHGDSLAAEEKPIGKFEMFDGWRPSPDFKRQAALWGRMLDGPEPGYSETELASFIAFWHAEGKAFHSTQWEQKFADSVVHEQRAAANKKPTGGSNAKQVTASAPSSAWQQVRDARNADRAKQGLAPLGDDGADLYEPLGEQERRSALDGLDSADFEVLG